MPAKKLRDLNIFFILDGSGSMASVQSDVVDGVNAFIEKQQKEKAKTNLWFTVFDTSVDKLYEGTDIKDVKPVTQNDTLKGGATALLDALGKTLADVDEKATKKFENLVIVYTDGYENSSREYKKEQIKVLREQLEGKGNWTFTFMGADMDAFAEASQYGVNQTNTLSVDSANTPMAFAALGNATHAHRTVSRSGQSASFYR